MRISQKVALSILVSLFVTGAFVALSYAGLFTKLEIGFFRERVIRDQHARLVVISDSIDAWNADNLLRFNALASERNFQAVFSSIYQSDEIAFRTRVSDSLEDSLIGFQGMRIVDAENRIQHSTLAGDIISDQAESVGRRVYRNWEQTSGFFALDAPADTSDSFVVYDGVSEQIVYVLPMQDTGFTYRGWMIVYINPVGLGEKLASEGVIGAAGRIQVIDKRGVIIDIRPEQVEAVRNDIDRLWPIGGLPTVFAGLAEDINEKYFLVSHITDDGTWVGKLVPSRLLGFTPTMRFLIFAMVFITASLLIFLLFNLRQDKTEVVRSRIIKLQVNLMRDWLENHEDRYLKASDLESRRGEVKKELQSGLGKLGKQQLKETDDIIDRGWDRIKEILADNDGNLEPGRNHTEDERGALPVDLKQLEEMITRAISEVKFVVPPEALAGIQVLPSNQSVQSPPRPHVDVSEAEELTELTELTESTEGDAAAEELTETDVAAEELIELEELADVAAETEELSDAIDLPDTGFISKEDALGSLEFVERNKEDVLEILPVVLSDDSRELVEIEKVNQYRPYMLNQEFDEPEEINMEIDEAADLKDPNNQDEEFEELEELEELVEAADDSGTASDNTVQFLDVEMICQQLAHPSIGDEHAKVENEDSSESMESLVRTRTTGLLPSVGSESDDFRFDDEEKALTWSADGLNYDRYLRGFKKGATGVYKSLMKLSKEYNAICGALLAGSRKGLETDYSVGLSERSATSLSITRDEPAWSEWFSERKIVLVSNLASSLYADKVKHNEFKYVKSAILIPAVYHSSQSYLFFGFKQFPEDPISVLTDFRTVR